MRTPLSIVLTATLLFSFSPVFSQSDDVSENADDSSIEVVVVTGVRSVDSLRIDVNEVAQQGIDNSDLLRLFPGGNRNSNGPVTRISQYRGLFGAQNNVSIDGQAYTSGGPNWMDSPLSSIPQSLTQSVTLFRGLGSVASIEEGLGGSIEIVSRQAGFSEGQQWSSLGKVVAGYGSNANSVGAAVYAGVHNQNNWLDAAVSIDNGDDYQFDGGVVAATEYDRRQYRVGYGHHFSRVDLNLGAVINRTRDSGTPALPMDIRYIDSEQYNMGLDASTHAGEVEFRAHVLSVEHLMDNFTLRPPPTGMGGMKMYRQTLATGDGGGFKLSYSRQSGDTDWLMGLDGNFGDHDADITDPGRAMFYIINFNDVERNRAGVFVQMTHSFSDWDVEAGLRYNQVHMNAGEVGGNLAMMSMGVMDPGMMNEGMMPLSQQDRLDLLALAFNQADRKKNDNQWSGIVKASRDLGDALRLNLGMGRKVRSPSYQERYLWLPMEATAGLADGYTYIGDINLKPETSLEFTVGIDWSAGRFKLSPEIYFRDVKNYIQGVPSTNPVANMFAMMMNGGLPLQYANVDAELYGLDLGYEFEINEAWMLRGNLGYVRGKRTDVSDNLYRIAPLSSFVELSWQVDRYFVSMESVAAARQDRVSTYNAEQQTAGWAIANLRGGVSLNNTFDISLGVENILDKTYRDHLGGYNRVAGSDVPLRERLISKGRNFYLRLHASW